MSCKLYFPFSVIPSPSGDKYLVLSIRLKVLILCYIFHISDDACRRS